MKTIWIQVEPEAYKIFKAMEKPVDFVRIVIYGEDYCKRSHYADQIWRRFLAKGARFLVRTDAGLRSCGFEYCFWDIWNMPRGDAAYHYFPAPFTYCNLGYESKELEDEEGNGSIYNVVESETDGLVGLMLKLKYTVYEQLGRMKPGYSVVVEYHKDEERFVERFANPKNPKNKKGRK